MRKKGDGWCLITWYGQKLKRQEAPTLVSLKGWLLAWWKRWALRQKNVGLFFKYSLIWQNRVFVVACGILSCRVWALWCSLWDPVPWPGAGPRPPAFGAQSLSHWTTREIPEWCRFGKEPACQCRRYKRRGFDRWVGKIPWRRKRQPTPVFLPGKPMDRGAWRATPWGHRVGHGWATDTTTTGTLWPQVVRFSSCDLPNVFFLKHFQFFLYSEDTVVVVQLFICAWFFATPRTIACQASLSFTVSQSLLRLMSRWWCHPTISSSVIPFPFCPRSFPASGSFLMSRLFASGGQSIGASASASVLPMNIQGWFLRGLTEDTDGTSFQCHIPSLTFHLRRAVGHSLTSMCSASLCD